MTLREIINAILYDHLVEVFASIVVFALLAAFVLWLMNSPPKKIDEQLVREMGNLGTKLGRQWGAWQRSRARRRNGPRRGSA